MLSDYWVNSYMVAGGAHNFSSSMMPYSKEMDKLMGKNGEETGPNVVA